MSEHTTAAHAPARAYRWADLPRDTPMPLLERFRLMGTHAMISRVILNKGCVVPTHAHPNEQMSIIISGSVRFHLPSPTNPNHRELLTPGQILHLPSHAPHGCEALERTEILDIFSPPSEKTGIDRT